MSKTKKIVIVPMKGLVTLLGANVTLFCINYIYTGKLSGVNEEFVKLENPSIVYETGAFDTKDWKDAQKLPHEIYIMKSAIESFGIIK